MIALNMNSTDSKETPQSKTLATMELSPKTVCADCQNAVLRIPAIVTTDSGRS